MTRGERATTDTRSATDVLVEDMFADTDTPKACYQTAADNPPSAPHRA